MAINRCLVGALILFASTASAQVKVDVRAEKLVVLEGEPIYFTVDITNISPEYSIGYGAVGHDLHLQIPDRREYEWRTMPCNDHHVSGGGWGGVDHPPIFAPGKTVTFRYLLKGYRLKPGRYEIRVVGTAPVRWFQYRTAMPFGPADPVVGANVDRTVTIEVVAATDTELEAALAPLIAKEESFGSDGQLAREGLFESARPFLLDRIARLAAHPNFRDGGSFEALADIDSPEARGHLRRLYDDSTELSIRADIVRALQRNPHSDNLDFLASLVPGRVTPADSVIKDYAVDGLFCIGGDDAIQAIATGTRMWTGDMRRYLTDHLGESGSRVAVAAIVDYDPTGDEQVFYAACSALMKLTRHQWCDEDFMSATFVERQNIQARKPLLERRYALWQRWWAANGNKIRIFGPADPEDPSATMPKIK